MPNLCSVSPCMHLHAHTHTHTPPWHTVTEVVLTTILPPGPWLRTLTPNHWFSLLSFCTSAGGRTLGIRGEKRRPRPLLPSSCAPPTPLPQRTYLPGQCPLCSSQSPPGSRGKRRGLQCGSPAAQAKPGPGEHPPAACAMGQGQELAARILPLHRAALAQTLSTKQSVKGLRTKAKRQFPKS